MSHLKKRLHTDLYFKRNSCCSYVSIRLTSLMMDAWRVYFHFFNVLSKFCRTLLGRYSYPLNISMIFSILASSGWLTLKKTSCLQMCLNFCISEEARFLLSEDSAGSHSDCSLQQDHLASQHKVSFLSNFGWLSTVSSLFLEDSWSQHRVPDGKTCFLPCVKKNACKHS